MFWYVVVPVPRDILFKFNFGANFADNYKARLLLILIFVCFSSLPVSLSFFVDLLSSIPPKKATKVVENKENEKPWADEQKNCGKT